MFITRFGTFVYPFLTIILHRRGFSFGEIGLAMAAFGGGGLGASLVGGWFADRFGRRNAIVLGTCANALFTFLLYWAQTLPAIMLCAGLAGFMGGFFGPAGNALVADLVPEPLRLRAYSALRLAINAGFAFGTATGGFLVNHSAFWLFAGDALTTAAYGLLAFGLLPHGLRHSGTQARWSEALAHLRHDRRFLALLTAQFCAAMIMLQSTSAYSLEVAGRGLAVTLSGWQPSPEQIFGLLIGWNGLIIVGCELTLTRLTQRFEPRRVMCLGYLLLGGGFALNALPGGLGLLLTAMTVFTLGEMLAIPMGSTFVARIAPPAMRGRYMGALGTAWSAASVVGPQLGLRLFGVQPSLVWLGCGALGLVAACTLGHFGERGAEPVG
jgi:MFS family permease